MLLHKTNIWIVTTVFNLNIWVDMLEKTNSVAPDQSSGKLGAVWSESALLAMLSHKYWIHHQVSKGLVEILS